MHARIGTVVWQHCRWCMLPVMMMGALFGFGTACKSSVCWSVFLVLTMGVRSVQDAVFAVKDR